MALKHAGEGQHGVDVRYGKPRLCGANGRLVLWRKRKVACILACFVPLFALIVRRRTFLQEESSFVFVAMHMAIVLLHRVHVKPHLVMATLVGLLDAQSVGGECKKAPCGRAFQRSKESWGLRNPHTSDHVPGSPGPHNGVGPGGIGKSRSAKASSMILLLLALVVRRQAAPLKSPATRSTCSSYIMARIVRRSFLPIPRFLA